jgi:hypothetical protein
VVCVCVRVRACMCVCVCARARARVCVCRVLYACVCSALSPHLLVHRLLAEIKVLVHGLHERGQHVECGHSHTVVVTLDGTNDLLPNLLFEAGHPRERSKSSLCTARRSRAAVGCDRGAAVTVNSD